MTATFGRPVIMRAKRSTKRLASVAVIANCHSGRPKRRASSSPTQAASLLGSIVVMPSRARCSSASATAGRACPVMAPVSPRHRSTYSWPSTSTNRAPSARSTNTGKAPAHRVIHGIGTPARRLWLACSASSCGAGVVADEALLLVAQQRGQTFTIEHPVNLVGALASRR